MNTTQPRPEAELRKINEAAESLRKHQAEMARRMEEARRQWNLK